MDNPTIIDKITFCIPSKNNLRYLKTCINSIKNNSHSEHDIIVFLDEGKDGTEQWLIENNIFYIPNDSNSLKGIAYGYNRCIEHSKTNVVCMFHADMYMGKGFDINMLKHLKPNHIISGTRIEPPLHPVGNEKIIKNFGMYPEDFDLVNFEKFVTEQMSLNNNQITKGIFVPWICYKDDIQSIGMHDEFFHSYYEDSDIFNRFILNNIECIQSRDAFVYHLTCRGGQFQDGVEKITSDENFHNMKKRSMKHYIRKWGSVMKNDLYQHPIISPKYNIGFVVKGDYEFIEALEPWCSNIYINDPNSVILETLLFNEQPNTCFDLRERIIDISKGNEIIKNDIVLYIDQMKFTQDDSNIIQQLPDIIKNNGITGKFNVGNMEIEINQIDDHVENLIKI
jgi:glycosyltransferase involved in cell wall biosynthesis